MRSNLWVLAWSMVGCGAPTAQRSSVIADPPPGTHILALETHNDDSALAAWRDAINGDMHDTVRAFIPEGSVHLHGLPYVEIRSAGAGPNRVVDISGASRDSTIVYVDSSAHEPNGHWGAFAFMVFDSHVHLHRMTIVSLADSTQNPPEDGNSDEAVRFDGTYGGEYGEVDSLTVRGFRLTGIDVFEMKGVIVHDNEIVCLTSNDATHHQQTMGIWMRELQPPTPPNMPNGIIRGNTVWNCGADYLDIAHAQYVQVIGNTVSCFSPDCPNGSYVVPFRPIVGISLYSTGQPCDQGAPISNNLISGNTVFGNHVLSGGIIIQGTGTGHHNIVENNVVTNAEFRGIGDNPSSCPPSVSHGAFAANHYSHNTVMHTRNETGHNWLTVWDFYAAGQNDTVSFNQLCANDSPHTITVDSGATAYIVGNLLVPCGRP